jgi:hypothetical protein
VEDQDEDMGSRAVNFGGKKYGAHGMIDYFFGEKDGKGVYDK